MYTQIIRQVKRQIMIWNLRPHIYKYEVDIHQLCWISLAVVHSCKTVKLKIWKKLFLKNHGEYLPQACV